MEDPANIEYGTGFLKQLDAIMNAVKLPVDKLGELDVIFTDLENVLQEEWPGCKAIPFGSLTTGLAVTFSDVDCFMEIPEEYHKEDENFVDKAAETLLKHPDIFKDVVSVPRATTPIVKFVHVNTSASGDLTFKTLLGVKNSKLIANLMKFDSRILPMAIVIKYWARVQGISGPKRLTNHALMLMLIFYLQQHYVNILPSIKYLQKDTEEEIIDHWNTAFNTKVARFAYHKNNESICDLLGGFFEYYAHFNFGLNVVSPFFGKPLHKYRFDDLDSIPNCFVLYKKNFNNDNTMKLDISTPICIQDPFQQCRNVASCISSHNGFEIRHNFKFAYEVYVKEAEKDGDNFLKRILTEKPDLKKCKPQNFFIMKLFWYSLKDQIKNVNDWESLVLEKVRYIFDTILRTEIYMVERRKNRYEDQEELSIIISKPVWLRKQYLNRYAESGLKLLEMEQLAAADIKDRHADINLQISVTTSFYKIPNGGAITITLEDGKLDEFKSLRKLCKARFWEWFTETIRCN